MRQLIQKILFLALILLAIIGPVAFANKYAINRQLESDRFKLASNISTLIVGDSHSETSLDPSMLPGSANFSASGESAFFTYYKLNFRT